MLRLTLFAIPYYSLHSADKVGEHGIDLIESCKKDHDIGARMWVSFGEEA